MADSYPWQEYQECCERAYADAKAKIGMKGIKKFEKKFAEQAGRLGDAIVQMLDDEDDDVCEVALTFALFYVIANRFRNARKNPDDAPREAVRAVAWWAMANPHLEIDR